MATREKGAPDPPRTADGAELSKMLAEAKAIREFAKSYPSAGNGLPELEARIAALREEQQRVKPGSQRLRQLEADARRKLSEIASLDAKKKAANDRIDKERLVLARMDEEGVRLAQSLATLQASIATVAEEIKALAQHDPKQPDSPTLATEQVDGDKLFEFFKCCFPNVAASAVAGDKAIFQTKWDDFLKKYVPSSMVEANDAEANAPADSRSAREVDKPVDEDDSVLEAAEQQFRTRATTAEGEQKRQLTAKADAVAAKRAKKLESDKPDG